MASVTFGVNQATVTRAAERLQEQAADELEDLARRAGAEMVDYVQSRAGFFTAAPELYDAVEATVVQEADGPRVFISPDFGRLTEGQAIGLAITENGRRAYTIVPVNGKALAWDGADGRRTFAKQVFMPAKSGAGLLRGARDAVYQRMRRGSV